MLDFSKLTPTSRQFALKIFALYPEWQDYAKRNPESNTIEISVPRNVGDDGLCLDIHGDGGHLEEEITISMDGWHTHSSFFGHSGDEIIRSVYDAAVYELEEFTQFIKDLIEEKFVVITYNTYGHWHGCNSGAPSEINDMVALEPKCTSRIRSWKGTYDQDIPPSERPGCLWLLR